ncbi:MAG: hypothetical protein U0900_07230 [Myxococcota bacterium]
MPTPEQVRPERGIGDRRGAPSGLVLARVGLALAATVVGLGAGELALRVADLPNAGPFLQEFRGERFKLMAYDSNPSGAFDLDLHDAKRREALAERLSNPDELRTHWEETPWAVAFEFDAQGFREKALEPKAPGTTRIAILGDSFTVGHGLPNALAYPRLLEARLQRTLEHEREDLSTARAVEVLNLGRGNTGLPEIVRSADFALTHLAPDVLVYGYFLNDPVPTLEREQGSQIHDMLDAGWVSVADSPSLTRIGAVPRGPSRVVDLVKRFVADRHVTDATIAWYQRLHEPEAWAPTRRRIEAMAKVSRSKNARFVLLLLPLPYEIAHSPFAEAHRAMRVALEASGIEVVDALPALAKFSDDDLRLHPRDRHPSPTYTRVVADLLADVLSAGPELGRARSPR